MFFIAWALIFSFVSFVVGETARVRDLFINYALVAEYKKYYDGDEEVTEEKVLKDLKEYIKDFTDYENIEEVPFDELLDFIG